MSDILRFPVNDYVEETKIINTPDGEKTVVCKVYKHLQYVSNPVDADFQSLDIFIPVSINGQSVDCTGKPILLFIGVGGYMSCRNKGESSAPAGPGGMPMPGGSGGPQGFAMPGGSGGPMGFPAGGPEGGPPEGGPGGGPGGAPGAAEQEQALAAGYMVVEPGCRGRDNQWPDGTYYGKAPAAIVDLKAAVRYIRYNKDLLPGNTERIFSTGGSAGGALSSLLGASGNSPLFEPYLKEIGAADERDDIFGSHSLSPITNLENADGAYEWQYGSLPRSNPFSPGGEPVDQELSGLLADIYRTYQDMLALEGKDGTLSSNNIADYILKYFLYPSCLRALGEKTEEEKAAYLAKNPWITYEDGQVSFTFDDFNVHCGRMKGLPSFDDFEMSMAEPILFGNATTNARHFTKFSAKYGSGDMTATVDPEVEHLLKLMNPMYFVLSKNEGCAPHWWIRHGACDNHTSLPIMVNLTVALESFGKDVNSRLVWDGGHCADDDSADFVAWMGQIS